RVPQPGSRQVRSFPNEREGRSLPLRVCPPRDRSLIVYLSTSAGAEVFPALYVSQVGIGCLGQRLGDLGPEVVGDLVPAGTGDHHLELGLEVEGVQTRLALVEVPLD